MDSLGDEFPLTIRVHNAVGVLRPDGDDDDGGGAHTDRQLKAHALREMTHVDIVC